MKLGRSTVLVLLLSARSALAQPAGTTPESVPVRVRAELGLDCPSAESFLTRILARTPRARRAEATETGRQFELSVSPNGAAHQGTLVVQGGAEPTRREVVADSCEEVIEALALVAALTIDPDAVTSPLPNRRVQAAAPLPAAPCPAAPEPAVPEACPGVATVPALPVTTVVPAEHPSPPRTREDSASPRGFRVSAGLQAELAVGPTSPQILPVGRLWVGGGPLKDGRFAPTVGVSAAFGSRSVESSAGGADFTWMAFRLDGCAFDFLPGERWALRPCMSAEAGILNGKGRPPAGVMAESHLKPWAAAGFLARLESRPLGPLLFRLEGGPLIPLYSKTEFYLPNVAAGSGATSQVVKVSPIGFTLGLSAGLSLP